MGSDEKRELPKPDTTFVVDGEDKKLIPDIRQDFGSGMAIGRTLQFRAVPEGRKKDEATAWRILLVPTDVKQPTVALDVWDDADVGRGRSADVDVSYFGGHEQGVSRQHIRLRPTETALFLMDLGSSNGTQLNGVPVGPGMAMRLNDDDDIALGNLHFTLKILGGPSAESVPPSE